METICVMGLGYIGLPTASLLATKGFTVRGVDRDQKVVATIRQGKIHIYEPDLDVLVKSAVNSGNLTAANEPAPADVFIVAVPTPLKDGCKPDLTCVEEATAAIAPHVQADNLIVLESTSPVGTLERVAASLARARPDLSVPVFGEIEEPNGTAGRVYLAYCPERVLPGQILKELVGNHRVIGGINAESSARAEHFYQKFVSSEIFLTSCRTAEMVKLTENAFRDVNIGFANEIAMICDRLDINVWELVELANRHPRVQILRPGPGVGGHCIAVDPWFIVDSAPQEARIIRTARQVNTEKPRHIIRKVLEKADRFKAPVIACLGLSFKADIDDIRESPAVEIVEALAEKATATILVAEPHLKALPPRLSRFDSLQLVDYRQAVQKADIVVLLADHKAFIKMDRDMLREKVVIDTRGVFHQ